MNTNIAMTSTMDLSIQDPDLRSQHDFVGRQSRIMLVEIAAMVSMTLVSLACYLTGAEGLVGYIVPLTIIVVGAFANFAMIKQDSSALLTPLFGMRMIAMFMLGGGSLFHNFVSPDIQTGFDYMFVTVVKDVARVNLLWLVGLDILLIGDYVFDKPNVIG